MLSGKRIEEEERALLDAADALAAFANLEPAGVEAFRQLHLDFIPAVWWAKSNWLQERNLLLKAWRAGFPADLTLKLTTARLFGVAHILASAGLPAGIPNPSFTAQMITDALDNFDGRSLIGLAPNRKILAPDGTDITKEVKRRVESDPQVWPYQRAVLFLHVEPWRAKVCQECGRRFVADHARRKYCSIAGEGGSRCSALVIKRQHLDWGRENNWGREKSNTKKSGQRGVRPIN